MNRKIVLFIIFSLVFTSCRHAPSSTRGDAPAVPQSLKLISTTPVKEQGDSPTGWIYGMLGTLESEHIMKGDSVHLSSAYVIRMMLQEKALEYYLSAGEKKITLKGTAAMLVHYINKYGILPYDSYADKKEMNYESLCQKTQRLCQKAVNQKVGIARLRAMLATLFDEEMGYLPAKTVHMLGAEYTPLEFAHSVCYPEEYVALTSFTHHPFREYFALEIPANEHHDLYLNLPIEEMVKHIQDALKKGHPVCWEGDISEKSFTDDQKYYINVQPSEKNASQASRQKEFESLNTTDDHVMEIIGNFSYNGTQYFVCRNSKGMDWGCKGLVFLSEDYIKLKTVAVYMSEKAFLI